MALILEKCAGVSRKQFAPGTVLLSEGETSGRLYVLAEGSVEVLRGDTQVALIGEAGSVFGEMSVLLNRPIPPRSARHPRSACSCSRTPNAF